MKKYPIRSMFKAEKPGNVFMAFDLSQAETWCVAALANEQSMFFALNNGDIHAQTGVVLFHEKFLSCNHTAWSGKDDKICGQCGVVVLKDERYVSKRYNHSSSYKAGFSKLAEIINKDSIETGVSVSLAQSKKHTEKWHTFYHLKGWWDEVEHKLNTQGKRLRTVYGFERTFFAPWGDELLKEAIAFEPQSTVADHTFGAIHPEIGISGGIIGVRKDLRNINEVKLVHTAHDSLMLELPARLVDDIAPIVYRNMHRPLIINGIEFTIPVDGEVGERWGELEELKVAS